MFVKCNGRKRALFGLLARPTHSAPRSPNMSDDASAPAPEPAPAEDAKDAKQPVAAQAVDDDEQVPYAERLAREEEERCDRQRCSLRS